MAMILPVVPVLLFVLLTVSFLAGRRRLAARGPMFVWIGLGIVLLAFGYLVYSIIVPN